MTTFKPIAINKDGVVLPYQEGQFIVAVNSFSDGTNSYSAGVYVDMLGVRQELTMQGPQGEDGKQGVQGIPGQAATVQIGQVQTGAPGSPALVSNSGTEQNAVLNFILPQGKEGPQGQQGVQGESGIGDAMLSNTDGDSTENGFTQAAVKGVAQAKNYYNLGAFDSYVSNGDGTGTANRNSIEINRSNITRWFTFGDGDRAAFYCDKVKNAPQNSKIKANITNDIAIDTLDGSFNIYFDHVVTQIELEELVNNISLFLELLPEYQYTEKVIENQPLHTATQEEEIYWHEEWRKGLNLINNLSIYDQQGIEIVENKNSYLKVKITDGDPFFRSQFFNQLPEGTYTLFSNVGKVEVWQTINGNTTTNSTFTVPQSGQTDIHIEFEELTIGETYSIYLMLVRGSHPYPYEPYNGKLIHEKDLSGVQLFPEGVNPAQTIGGDWEDKGTVTTSDNTVFHAYRRL